MSTITLTLPEELYARVAAEAAKEGQAPDKFIASWLADRLSSAKPAASVPTEVNESIEGYDASADPLARFAGILASDDPGWIERHDAYFAGQRHGDEE